MALVQQNKWHSAGALGPKDIDSFGLSLLIKKSVISWLQSQSGKTCSGIVKIIPEYLGSFGLK